MAIATATATCSLQPLGFDVITLNCRLLMSELFYADVEAAHHGSLAVPVAAGGNTGTDGGNQLARFTFPHIISHISLNNRLIGINKPR